MRLYTHHECRLNISSVSADLIPDRNMSEFDNIRYNYHSEKQISKFCIEK